VKVMRANDGSVEVPAIDGATAVFELAPECLDRILDVGIGKDVDQFDQDMIEDLVKHRIGGKPW
jgi:hypothetical protein